MEGNENGSGTDKSTTKRINSGWGKKCRQIVKEEGNHQKEMKEKENGLYMIE